MATASGSSSSSSTPKRQRVAETPPPPLPSPPAVETDMLMSLPPEILDTILDRVPFRKLLTTTCLSQAWRYRWESIPNLDIDLPQEVSARVLWQCAASAPDNAVGIRSFHARVSGNTHFLRVASWLRALSRKGVQALILDFDNCVLDPKPPILLGSALFSCAALVRLALNDCRMPPAPAGFPGFPKLASLYLSNVALMFKGGGAQVEHLIGAAPDLNFLSLSYVVTKPLGDEGEAAKWFIRAPKLRTLVIMIQFEDNGCRIGEEEFPLLEDASISIDCLIGTQDGLHFFRRVAGVKKLWFDIESNMFIVNPLEEITWKFDNLRKAHLCATFGQLPSFMSIVSLLRCAPHIEHLSIEAEDDIESTDQFEIYEVLNLETSDDLFASLKFVSLSGIKHYSNQMSFMKFILFKAVSLQAFVVTFSYHKTNVWYEQACRELEEWRSMASPQVSFIPMLTDESNSIIDDGETIEDSDDGSE
uniref:F-box domain-containing protein n=1 Tax=Leersia perrieri TaxID=77586 RepID=A0A0D9X634_9ORYZ